MSSEAMQPDPVLAVVDIDYFEHDAILVVEGKRYYFQFSDQPTVIAALAYLNREGVVL